MNPQIQAIYGIWSFWALTWFVAAVWSGRTEKRPAAFSSVGYYAFVIAGGVMLFSSPIGANASSMPLIVGWILVVIAAGGVAFAWWARLHLGALWSGTVQKKEGHHVIDTGPYRLVRHPIYTGIITTAFATALAKETPIAFLGAAIMAYGWYLKARLEERFLRQELGQDAYGMYARRVPMLLPFI